MEAEGKLVWSHFIIFLINVHEFEGGFIKEIIAK